MNPVFRLVWTLAIVGLVAFVSRATSSSSEASAESVRCEMAPPRDVAGLEACVARFPRDVELLVELAAAYDSAGRTEAARSMYRRAVDVDPRDADVQRRLAESLRR
jgi:cytochrome c-type biogenesis protein CcmH/NrfG